VSVEGGKKHKAATLLLLLSSPFFFLGEISSRKRNKKLPNEVILEVFNRQK